MTRNYGRDISKYFFGGYAMVSGQKQVVHSIQALGIAKKMVIGYIET
jgi:hypothetical protein